MDEQRKETEQTDLPSVPDRAETETEDGTRGGVENNVYDWAKCLISAVVAVVLLFTFVVRLIGVSGPSMQDTLYTGDRVLILNSLLCSFKAGDVVVVDDYNAEAGLEKTLVKRIVATGGQTVDIDFVQGVVYVDGEALDEPYIKEPTYTSEGTQFPLTLAEDEVFLMGDNRNHSTDSRSDHLGPVKVGYLQGKAIWLLVPGVTPDTEKRDWSRIGLVD